MSRPRRYRLLCPIARALDRIGDRWTLLILRELHAGPARFNDLHAGLPGLASNLLTDRLRQLEQDGFVRHRKTELGVSVYELTEEGQRTDELLYELAALGTRFPADEEIRRPGNLRTIAATLKVACRRVVDNSLSLRAGLVVDGEHFELSVDNGSVDVRYREARDPEVELETSYEALVAVADGDLSPEKFAEGHMQIRSSDPKKAEVLMDLLGRAMTQVATN